MAEGSKDIRLAVARSGARKWTGLKVFTVQNKDNIKREIERAIPALKGQRTGHFPHWPKYKVVCYQALTPGERDFYVEQAIQWNYLGPSDEAKQAYGIRD